MAEHCFLSQNVPSRILAVVLIYDIPRYDNLVTNLTTSRHNPSWVVADSSELNFVVNFEKQIFKRKKMTRLRLDLPVVGIISHL